MHKPSKSKIECEHAHTQRAKDAYGRTATWCSNCGSRLSKNPQDDRPAPGTVGHRISLTESVMFGQSKVKDFPSTLSGGVESQTRTIGTDTREAGKPFQPWSSQHLHGSRRSDLPAQNTSDAETLCALQFALAPLDRAMRDADVESWPRQLMHRTVFTSILQSAEDERRERDKDLEYESRVDYASWETDGQNDE